MMPCEGCKKQAQQITEIQTKLDALTERLDPLIKFAEAFMNSTAGKLQQAMMRRRGGG